MIREREGPERARGDGVDGLGIRGNLVVAVISWFFFFEKVEEKGRVSSVTIPW